MNAQEKVTNNVNMENKKSKKVEKRCKKSYAENRKARTVKGRGANTVLWL